MLIPYAEAMDGCRSVKQWARNAGVSMKRLRRAVLKATGQHPQDLLRLARVVYVLDLAQREGGTLAQAAYTQFPDPFTFSQCCVRALGIRPSIARNADLRALVQARLHESRPVCHACGAVA